MLPPYFLLVGAPSLALVTEVYLLRRLPGSPVVPAVMACSLEVQDEKTFVHGIHLLLAPLVLRANVATCGISETGREQSKGLVIHFPRYQTY